MKNKVDQALANRIKVLRTAVRLKYSIMADNELNQRVDEERKKFYKAVQEGRVLPPLTPQTALLRETSPRPETGETPDS